MSASSIRTHVGVLCQQVHLYHRTVAQARRCDAETAEAQATERYYQAFKQRSPGWGAESEIRRVSRATQLLILAIAVPITAYFVITEVASWLVRLVAQKG